jgi:hypothetical protein
VFKKIGRFVNGLSAWTEGKKQLWLTARIYQHSQRTPLWLQKSVCELHQVEESFIKNKFYLVGSCIRKGSPALEDWLSPEVKSRDFPLDLQQESYPAARPGPTILPLDCGRRKAANRSGYGALQEVATCAVWFVFQAKLFAFYVTAWTVIFLEELVFLQILERLLATGWLVSLLRICKSLFQFLTECRLSPIRLYVVFLSSSWQIPWYLKLGRSLFLPHGFQIIICYSF